jgi:hypothetical protein
MPIEIPGGGGGYRSYTTYRTVTRKVTLTFTEALNSVSTGLMEPGELFRQLDQKTQQAFNNFSKGTNGKDFSALSGSALRNTITGIKDNIAGHHEQLTLKDAISRAADGTFPVTGIYDQMPKYERERVNEISIQKNGLGYRRSNVLGKREALREFLDELTSVPERLTLTQAIGKVCRGTMSADTVYEQLEGDVRKVIEQIALQRFKKSFSAISNDDKATVLAAFIALAQASERHRPEEFTHSTPNPSDDGRPKRPWWKFWG